MSPARTVAGASGGGRSDGGLAVTSAGQPMELSSHSQSRGAHLETLAGNPVLWDLHLHEKKIKKSKQEQGGQRGKEYNNI